MIDAVSSVLITGSNDGLGRDAARRLVDGGHRVVGHANALAPYLLTAVMEPAGRLAYLTSGLHEQGETHLEDLDWIERPWDGRQAYADSKLFDAARAAAMARRRPDTVATSVTPGWVATKMGGAGASDD